MKNNLNHAASARITQEQYETVVQLKELLGFAENSDVVRYALQMLAYSEGIKWPPLPADFRPGTGGFRGGGHPSKFLKPPTD